MRVVYPGDALEAHKAVVAATQLRGPISIRPHRAKTPVFTTPRTPFVVGRANVLWVSGKGPAFAKATAGKKPDVAIIATGPMSYEALVAAHDLEKQKIATAVIHMHTIRPLDEKTILEWAKKAGSVVTAEEHSVRGGLGSAVAELLSGNYPVPMEFVGVGDQFGQSGTADELAKAYNLTAKDIVDASKRVVKRK